MLPDPAKVYDQDDIIIAMWREFSEALARAKRVFVLGHSLNDQYLLRALVQNEAPEIDYRAELPPHRQIAAWLLGRIESGELAVGQPVPSEKELMDLFGVARTTVRRAIAYLRDQAVIRTVPGRGSYVANRRS
jgi:hypothetical protein